METHQPKTLHELKALRKPVQDVNKVQKEKLSPLDKVALWITEHVGTMGFFIIIFIWTVFWLGWNTVAPRQIRFDPHPAFVLWLFISNMIQIFLMPLIMIGQNLQSRHAENRAESDFEVNLKAEREIETIIQHLENQNKILSDIQQIISNKKE